MKSEAGLQTEYGKSAQNELTGRDGDDRVSNLLAEIGLCGFLHLRENHCGNFFRCLEESQGHILTISRITHKLARLFTVFDRNDRLASAVNDLEGPVLDVALELGFVKLAADETLGIKDSVLRI